MKTLAALTLCAGLWAMPSAAQVAQMPRGEDPATGSLVCFFMLLESGYQGVTRCGRVFGDEETRRFQRAYRRLESYILERAAPLAERAIQALCQDMARAVPECSGQAMENANRFIDEVVNDSSFPMRLEEELRRDPNPLEGGCL